MTDFKKSELVKELILDRMGERTIAGLLTHMNKLNEILPKTLSYELTLPEIMTAIWNIQTERKESHGTPQAKMWT